MSDVWYACYGSNLLEARFRGYILGDTPPRATHEHSGARDRTWPCASRPFTIRHRLYFAESAPSWGGGGVAFLEPERTVEAPTLGRLWRLTPGQFRDVFLQENGHEPRESSLELPELSPGESRTVSSEWYGHLMHLGLVEDLPVYTFTRPPAFPTAKKRPPSRDYLATIAAGLRDTHPSLSDQDLNADFGRAEAAVPPSPNPGT